MQRQSMSSGSGAFGASWRPRAISSSCLSQGKKAAQLVMSGGKPPADDLLRPRDTRLALRNFDATSMGAAVSIGEASRAACTGIVATLSCPALHVMAPGQ